MSGIYADIISHILTVDSRPVAVSVGLHLVECLLLTENTQV